MKALQLTAALFASLKAQQPNASGMFEIPSGVAVDAAAEFDGYHASLPEIAPKAALPVWTTVKHTDGRVGTVAGAGTEAGTVLVNFDDTNGPSAVAVAELAVLS